MKWVLLSFFALFCAQPALAQRVNIVYAVQDGGEQRLDYGVTLLRLALSKVNASYDLKRSDMPPTTQGRVIEMVREGREANITWTGTSRDLERKLLPVRVPIERGILGWRLMVINAGQQGDFDKVRNLTNLKAFTAVQGIGWADGKILQKNGIGVTDAPFDTLFKMIEGRRADFFPLGANEVFLLVDQYKAQLNNIAVEQGVVLVYPFAMYFFLTPGLTDLAAALETGLKRAQADGSFDQVFHNHIWLKDAFGRADLARRRVIVLDNATLSPETLALPDSMFFRPK